jgi:hypothetical protein
MPAPDYQSNSGFLCRSLPATKLRRNSGTGTVATSNRWALARNGYDAVAFWPAGCARRVVAVVVLYVLQDRLLLPPVPNVTDIRMGHHAGYDIQPWHPRDEYAGYVIAPAGREPIGTFLVYHGNAESTENKQSLAEVFVRFGYRVVLVEYPGYGRRQGARTMKAALAASRSALSDAKAQWAGTIFLVASRVVPVISRQKYEGSFARATARVFSVPRVLSRACMRGAQTRRVTKHRLAFIRWATQIALTESHGSFW